MNCLNSSELPCSPHLHWKELTMRKKTTVKKGQTKFKLLKLTPTLNSLSIIAYGPGGGGGGGGWGGG